MNTTELLSLSEIIQPFQGENDEHPDTHITSPRARYVTLFAHAKSLAEAGSKNSEAFKYLMNVFKTANDHIGNDEPPSILIDERGSRPGRKKLTRFKKKKSKSIEDILSRILSPKKRGESRIDRYIELLNK